MKTISLISRIERYARNNPRWIPGGEYERLSMDAGFKASNCSRRLRELSTGEAPVLERKIQNGHVWYRFIQKYSQDMKPIESMQIEEPKAVEKAEVQGALL